MRVATCHRALGCHREEKMTPHRTRAAALLVLALAVPSTVAAHTLLQKSVPAAGAALTSAPLEIRLEFDETIEARIPRSALRPRAAGPLPPSPPPPIPTTRRCWW